MSKWNPIPLNVQNIVRSYVFTPKEKCELKQQVAILDEFNHQSMLWNVKLVNDMEDLFKDNGDFNSNLNNWDVNSATNISGMFSGASSFNQPLEQWNVSSVGSIEMENISTSVDKSVLSDHSNSIPLVQDNSANNDVTKPVSLEEIGNPRTNPLPETVFRKKIQEQKACFGAGCYWGTEKYFRYDFKKNYSSGKVLRGQVGFMGPEDSPKNPSYKDVCSGKTGHVEVYDFDFLGDNSTYEDLCKFFFQFHDPTTMNKQGNDVGTQYASVIFCYNEDQLKIASDVRDRLQRLIDEGHISCYKSSTVSTDIRRASEFFPAHSEHQDYLTKNPKGYCNHRIRFKAWDSL